MFCAFSQLVILWKRIIDCIWGLSLSLIHSTGASHEYFYLLLDFNNHLLFLILDCFRAWHVHNPRLESWFFYISTIDCDCPVHSDHLFGNSYLCASFFMYPNKQLTYSWSVSDIVNKFLFNMSLIYCRYPKSIMPISVRLTERCCSLTCSADRGAQSIVDFSFGSLWNWL